MPSSSARSCSPDAIVLQKDFYYDMESLVFDPKHMMTYFYFPVSGEVVAKDGSVTKADDDMLCDYHKMIGCCVLCYG